MLVPFPVSLLFFLEIISILALRGSRVSTCLPGEEESPPLGLCCVPVAVSQLPVISRLRC